MNAERQTVIGHSKLDKLVLYGGFPVVGLALGFFLPRIADWAMTIDWLPKGPLRFVSEWDAWWVTLTLMLAGLIAGVLLAARSWCCRTPAVANSRARNMTSSARARRSSARPSGCTAMPGPTCANSGWRSTSSGTPFATTTASSSSAQWASPNRHCAEVGRLVG